MQPQTNQNPNLIVDLSNIVWMLYHSEFNKKGKQQTEFLKSLLIQETVKHIVSSANRFNADGILIACDSPRSWRKEIFPEYKANRENEKKIHFEEVVDTMNTLFQFFNVHTDIPAIAVKRAEADDIIAVAAKMSSLPVVIISGDTDFVQLIDSNTRLYAPALRKERESEDPAYDLFLKCIRGDKSDNIESAFPRVYEKRLAVAWKDQVEMLNVMETILKDGRKVADLYNRNKRLIDLNNIPDDVVNAIGDAVDGIKTLPNKYEYIALLRALGQQNLKDLARHANAFSEVFRKRFVA